jgi:IclR family transcriptional regulator, KDG regulon repressor
VDLESTSRFSQRNQAVERAIQVLELLSAGDAALSLQEMSRRLNLHPSTLHRILKTLEEQDYLARFADTEQYRLGPRILTLAARMLNTLPIREVAAPYLRRLSIELGQSVALAAYEHGRIMYLDCAESPSPVGIFLRPGGRVAAQCVASGRVLLAFRDEAELERVLESALPCPGPSNPTPKRLRRDLAVIRERGYAIDDNFVPGLRAVAAPVLDAAGSAVAALTVIGMSGTFSLPRLQETIPALRSTANAISTHLGYDRSQSRSEAIRAPSASA